MQLMQPTPVAQEVHSCGSGGISSFSSTSSSCWAGWASSYWASSFSSSFTSVSPPLPEPAARTCSVMFYKVTLVHEVKTTTPQHGNKPSPFSRDPTHFGAVAAPASCAPTLLPGRASAGPPAPPPRAPLASRAPAPALASLFRPLRQLTKWDKLHQLRKTARPDSSFHLAQRPVWTGLVPTA